MVPNSKFTATTIPKRSSNFKPEFISSSSFVGEKNPFFGITVDDDHKMLAQIESDIVNFVRHLPQVLDVNVVENNGEYLVLALRKQNEKLRLEVNNVIESNASGTNFKIDIPFQHYGVPEKMWVSMYSRREGDTLHRIFFTTQDDAFILYQLNGKLIWAREEALSAVANVEMIDLPMSESDIQFEQEFRLDDTNLLTMLLKRLTSQVFQLENSILAIISGLYPRRNLMAAETSSTLTRDVFSINKIIVVATLSGKLFGIDSTNGKIIWQQYIPNLGPFDSSAHQPFSLFSQTKTTHFSQAPQCAIVGVDKRTKNGLLYQFHSLTGEPIGVGIINFDFKIAQIMLLPPPEDDHLRGILLLDKIGHVHVYPDSATRRVRESMSSFYLYTAKHEGSVTGFSLSLKNDNILATPVWSIKLPPFHSITHVVVKPLNEHVHSQGRVMGDRSVTYKYLNPNLVGVIAKGTDSQLKPFFKMILVDVITGNIVFSAVHKRCRGPIHAVLSENWAVYAYFNEKSRRTEMTVLELYEGKIQSNSTAFSSLNPPQLPMVERQAYLFPPVALPNGGIVELPKSVLDPRRSVFPTSEHREESIYPYVPELPVPSESVINYNQSSYNVRGISTAAAGLESTCLVFAYGLDLFFARVTPSRTFDVLKDDFDHFLISVVLISLILGAYLIRQLAARKALHQAWNFPRGDACFSTTEVRNRLTSLKLDMEEDRGRNAREENTADGARYLDLCAFSAVEDLQFRISKFAFFKIELTSPLFGLNHIETSLPAKAFMGFKRSLPSNKFFIVVLF
uniref:ER membrane protein complex subunit 1 n=1 Tax=Strigamia maritima TaxID=126957 RepID=T1JPE2_STRMM